MRRNVAENRQELFDSAQVAMCFLFAGAMLFCAFELVHLISRLAEPVTAFSAMTYVSIGFWQHSAIVFAGLLMVCLPWNRRGGLFHSFRVLTALIAVAVGVLGGPLFVSREVSFDRAFARHVEELNQIASTIEEETTADREPIPVDRRIGPFTIHRGFTANGLVVLEATNNTMPLVNDEGELLGEYAEFGFVRVRTASDAEQFDMSLLGLDGLENQTIGRVACGRWYVYYSRYWYHKEGWS
ncbi:hypothetical protein [Stratiformator vulcanicus]|uniref:Uncharacterized protein n=1 Tax=Stratiformator vulcanicus TaxID=2527980 RepID=A0A517R144_9PLAN|nr:hypothetical protein [Stratiformator vulcanicus]QDT37612.1 hypothetical protein Pan189_19920 [Stratiformator vulcanicus]